MSALKIWQNLGSQHKIILYISVLTGLYFANKAINMEVDTSGGRGTIVPFSMIDTANLTTNATANSTNNGNTTIPTNKDKSIYE